MSEVFCNTNHLDLWEVGGGLIGAAQEAQECRQHSHALHCGWCGDAPGGAPLTQAHGEAGTLLQRLLADQGHESLDSIQAHCIFLHCAFWQSARLFMWMFAICIMVRQE